MLTMMKTIKTEHFVLRPFKKGDEDTLQKNINDKDITKTLSVVPYPYTMKHAKEWITHATSKLEKEVIFAIDFGEGVEGVISLKDIDTTHKRAEFGYWLAKKRWGKGYMTEALNALVTFAFSDLKLVKVYAYTFLNNPASSRVLEKAGFEKEAVLKKHLSDHGKQIDVNMYGLVNPKIK